MKTTIAALLGLTVLSLSAAPATGAGGGGRLLESYVARLSAQDHVNSSGEQLTSAAAIIRQDRANFHVYMNQDAEDQDDRFFANANNRARLEAMLNAGSAGPGVRRAIVNGRPLIRVDVYANFVRVTVL